MRSTYQAGVYLLPDLKFESEGKIQVWEVLAMKPGVIRLLVSIKAVVSTAERCNVIRMNFSNLFKAVQEDRSWVLFCIKFSQCKKSILPEWSAESRGFFGVLR